MITRSSSVLILYNGADITEVITPYITDFNYTDPAGGEADSVSISVHNRDGRWLDELMPRKGDTIKAVIVHNSGNASEKFDCGTFTIDSISFQGPPSIGSISGVSVPANTDFKEAKHSQTWENVTLYEVGKEISEKAGINFEWDPDSTDMTLSSIEQSEQTDSEFFSGLCDKYGLTVKVYSDRLIVFDREKYKEKPAADTLTPSDMVSWNWSTELQGSCTGGEFSYTDPLTEEEFSVSIGTGGRTLKMSGKADSPADAERQLKAGYQKANHGIEKLNVTIPGGRFLAAGQTVNVLDLGKLSGKYYIDSVAHKISSSGYEMTLDMSSAAVLDSGASGSSAALSGKNNSSRKDMVSLG